MLYDTCTKVPGAAKGSGRTITHVQPIHTRIPGRARFKVTALYRSRPVKHRLESKLRSVEGIVSTHGDELTGNLLVVFDRCRTVEDVVQLIAATLGKLAPPVVKPGVSAAPPYRPNQLPITARPALLRNQAIHSPALPVGLVASSPLVLLPISFLRTFSVGLFQALPIVLLFTTSIAILGLVVGKKEGWSRADALYFAFATASTVGFSDLRPTKASTKIISISIGLLGLLLTGMVTALGFLSAQKAFKTLN